MSLGTALAADVIAKEHDTGRGHPERPERFDAALGAVADLGLRKLAPRRAEVDEVALVHARPYIRTGDTHVGMRSYEVALHAVGGLLNAIDAVLRGESANAFCIVRPPGHHAGAERGMGFCVFNNIAIAARYAQRKYQLGRVLIADWDVHHGNGTQDIFYEDGSVFFFSTHQHPWYPGTGSASETGAGKGKDTTLNCPLPAGSGRDAILGAFESKLGPAVERFKPELILLSAGFDSRVGDPLGQFLLSDEDFAELTKLMLGLADQYAGGRLVSVLEGGYSLTGLAAGVRAHASALSVQP